MKALLLFSALLCIVFGIKHLVRRLLAVIDTDTTDDIDNQYTYERMSRDEFDNVIF